MRRFHFILFLILTLSGCAGVKKPAPEKPDRAAAIEAPAPSKTVIHDPAEAKQLLGKHLFSKEAYSGYFGEAVVFENNGVYYIHGLHYSYREQKLYGVRRYDLFAGGHVKIDGTINQISDGSFLFSGTIETSMLYKDAFYPCLREGTYLFSRKKHQAYWRLQNMITPDTCLNNPFYKNEAIDLFYKHEL